MTVSKLPEGLSIVNLTKEFAEHHLPVLTYLANSIPLVDYSADEILAESKGDRPLKGKWLHGLAVIRPGDIPVAYVGAYERAAENNDQYPTDTLYISELAVNEKYRKQGIAKALMSTFFRENDAVGFQILTGDLNYSVQTNSATWNQPVIDLYKSLGFVERALKEYDDRTDVVLGRKSDK